MPGQYDANARTSSQFCTPLLYAHTKRNSAQAFSLHQFSVAALWADEKGLPVLDAALHVFLTLPDQTCTREDQGQPVGSAAMRLPVWRRVPNKARRPEALPQRTENVVHFGHSAFCHLNRA